MDASAFDIRPVSDGDDDLRAAVSVMALLDRGQGSIKDLRSLRSTMQQIVHLVAWADGQPVGFGFAGTWPGGESYPLLGADIAVSPTHRRRGVGSALFRTLSEPARTLGKTGFQFEVFEDHADALAFLLERGYTEVGRELQFEFIVDVLLRHPPAEAVRQRPAIMQLARHPQRRSVLIRRDARVHRATSRRSRARPARPTSGCWPTWRTGCETQ